MNTNNFIPLNRDINNNIQDFNKLKLKVDKSIINKNNISNYKYNFLIYTTIICNDNDSIYLHP